MKRYDACTALSLFGMALFLPDAASATVSAFSPANPIMAQYVKKPTYLTASAKPRVMLIFDNSGSMNSFAYANDPDASENEKQEKKGEEQEKSCSESFLENNPNLYGYFDPNASYTYNGDYWDKTDSADSGVSGNELNCLYMDRVDIARKVLTGGKLSGDTTPDGRPILVTQGGYHDGYYDEKGRVAASEKEVAGVVQATFDDVSYGLTLYDIYSNGGLVTNPIGDSVDDIIATINNTPPRTATPLAETLYTVIGYFQQRDERETSRQYLRGYDFKKGFYHKFYKSKQPLGPRYYNESHQRPLDRLIFGRPPSVKKKVSYEISKSWDPFWSDSEGEMIDCAESFVILVTDGLPVEDTSIPRSLVDTDGDGDEMWPKKKKGDGPTDSSDYLDDVAGYAYNTDLRSDIAGKQNLEVYPVFAFGTEEGRELLQNTAENAGGLDHYKDASDGEALSEALHSILGDIMAKTSSGGSVAVLNSSRRGNGAAYQSLYHPYIEEETTSGKVKVKWTGEVRALLIDSNGNLREDSNNNRQVDMEEDLVFSVEKDTADELMAVLTKDVNGDGVIDPETETPTKKVPLDDVNYLWSASKLLSELSPVSLDTNRSEYVSSTARGRYIHTWIDENNDGIVDAGEYRPFTTGGLGAGVINYFFGTATGERRNFDDSDDLINASDLNLLINWVRGQEQDAFDMRSRTLGSKTFRLGDIDRSSPTAVQRPGDNFDTRYNSVSYRKFKEKYRDRRTMVYAGSNDGIFHAFNSGFFIDRVKDPATGAVIRNRFWLNRTADSYGNTVSVNDNGPALGQEMWAYIPYNLLPHLQWLPQKDYQHIYYNDLKPRTFAAKLWSESDSVHVGGWGTILVGGMRWGGGPIKVNVSTDEDAPDERTMRSAYFIFDITDPEQPPVLLSEFTPDSDFSFTTVYPDVVSVTSDGDADPSGWYLVFGTGPTSLKGESDQEGKLLVRKFKTGLTMGQGLPGHTALWEKIDGKEEIAFTSGEENSFISAPYAADMQPGNPVKNKGAFTSDVVYFGTVAGRFGEKIDDPGTWTGRMHRVVLEDANDASVKAANPLTWKETIFYDPAAPISTGAAVARDDKKNIWVYFGTGRFFHSQDKKNVADQAFYGIKEPMNAAGKLTWQQVDSGATFIDSTNTEVYGGSDASTSRVKNSSIASVTTFEELETEAESTTYSGWKINLNGGSRVFIDPSVVAGVVNFSAYRPALGICDTSGESTTYSTYYKTGTAYWDPIMGQDKSVSINVDKNGNETSDPTQKQKRNSSSFSNPGVTTGAGYGTTNAGRVFANFGRSTGEMETKILETPLPVKSGKIYWQQIRK